WVHLCRVTITNEDGKIPNKLRDGVRGNPLSNIRGGRLPHLSQAATILPGPIHCLVNKFHGRSFGEEAVDAVVNQVSMPRDVRHNCGAATKHSLYQSDGHPFEARWKYQGVMFGPKPLNIVNVACNFDLR